MVSRRVRRVGTLFILVLVGVVVAGAVGFLTSRDRTAVAMPECPAGPAIVLDPGHGGIDGGANRLGILEKEIVLDIGRQTRDLLQQRQIPVIMTRSEDVDLGGPNDNGRLRRDLNYRVQVANHCRSVVMVSLHVNSATNEDERGMMIFYQTTRAGRDIAYLFDTMLRDRNLHSRTEVPHYRTGWAVFRTKAPAVLIEMGFISNAADRQLLTDSGYRTKVAAVLADACAEIYQNWAK